MRAAATTDEQPPHADAAASAAPLPRKKAPTVSRAPEPPSDATTCAAAVETLLWFGHALGESSRGGKGRGGKGRGGGRGMAFDAAASANEFDAPGAGADVLSLDSWDWVAAMEEAGLQDLPPIDAAPASAAPEPADEPEAELPRALEGNTGERFESDASSESTPSERAPSESTPSRSGEGEDDGGASSTEGSTSKCDDAERPASSDDDEQRARPRDHYLSPRRTAPDGHATRRSRAGRTMKPSRSLLSAMEEPLLKWEKEQQRQQRQQRGRDKKAGVRLRRMSSESTVGTRTLSIDSMDGSMDGQPQLYDTDVDCGLDCAAEPLSEGALLEHSLDPLCSITLEALSAELGIAAPDSPECVPQRDSAVHRPKRQRV